MKTRSLIVIACTLAAALTVNAQNRKETLKVAITQNDYAAISDVTYQQYGNRRMKMHILIPNDGKKEHPAIVYFPGGGFISANIDSYLDWRIALCKAGFVVASAEYRCVPDRYPALVTDGKAAVRFLRAHAGEYRINTRSIGVLGDSAGGYVAAMIGMTNGDKRLDMGDNLGISSDVQAAATIYGITNLLNIGEGHGEEIEKIHLQPNVTEALLINGYAFFTHAGGAVDKDKKHALECSPIGRIGQESNSINTSNGKIPPFLIMHGNNDGLVSQKQSDRFYNALAENDCKADYIVLDGAGHGDPMWHQQQVIDRVVEWFRENLK